jgi:hypothetical protein
MLTTALVAVMNTKLAQALPKPSAEDEPDALGATLPFPLDQSVLVSVRTLMHEPAGRTCSLLGVLF